MPEIQLLFAAAPPYASSIVAAGGLATISSRMTTLALVTLDWTTRLGNVTHMKVWGSLDPGFRPEVLGANEGAAKWQPYAPTIPIVVSAGDGTKTIHAKVRNSSGTESEDMSQAFTLDADASPHSTLLWTDGRRSLKPGQTMRYGWSCSHAWTRMDLAISPLDDSPLSDCTIVSSNTTGAAAGAHVAGSVTLAQITAVDPYQLASVTRRLRMFTTVAGTIFG